MLLQKKNGDPLKMMTGFSTRIFLGKNPGRKSVTKKQHRGFKHNLDLSDFAKVQNCRERRFVFGGCVDCVFCLCQGCQTQQ